MKNKGENEKKIFGAIHVEKTKQNILRLEATQKFTKF